MFIKHEIPGTGLSGLSNANRTGRMRHDRDVKLDLCALSLFSLGRNQRIDSLLHRERLVAVPLDRAVVHQSPSCPCPCRPPSSPAEPVPVGAGLRTFAVVVEE